MVELFPEGFEETEHSDGVELAAYTDASGEERLWAAFGTVSEPRGYVLHSERKHAEEAMTLFAEYGYAVFKELTQLAGYPPKVLPRAP